MYRQLCSESAVQRQAARHGDQQQQPAAAAAVLCQSDITRAHRCNTCPGTCQTSMHIAVPEPAPVPQLCCTQPSNPAVKTTVPIIAIGGALDKRYTRTQVGTAAMHVHQAEHISTQHNGAAAHQMNGCGDCYG
jgi:hypothetical protein